MTVEEGLMVKGEKIRDGELGKGGGGGETLVVYSY